MSDKSIFKICINKHEVSPVAAALFDAPGVEEPGLETVRVLVLVGQQIVVFFERVVLYNRKQ